MSAWEFEPELEIANCFVEARTEIEFFDSECTVMSNLPVPKQNEVYYWEAKVYDKPENTLISIGMATKPYPLFRLPGWYTSVTILQNKVTDEPSKAFTSTLSRTYPTEPVATTNLSMLLPTARKLFKAMLLASATAREVARFSSPETERSWRM